MGRRSCLVGQFGMLCVLLMVMLCLMFSTGCSDLSETPDPTASGAEEESSLLDETTQESSFAAETPTQLPTETQTQPVEPETTEAVPEGPQPETHLQYVARYGQLIYENEYVRMGAIPGVVYVDCGSYMNFYVAGYPAGGLRMIRLEEDGEPEGYMRDHYSGSGVTYELMKVHRAPGAAWSYYYYKINELPFGYGDTEWLVDHGIYESLDEALQQSDYDQTVELIVRKDGSPYAYVLWADIEKISEYVGERLWADMVEAVSQDAFHEKAYQSFQKNTYHEFSLVGQGDLVFMPDNRDRISRQVQVGDLVYRVPEGTAAVQQTEDHWKIYDYDNEYIGDIRIYDETQWKEQEKSMPRGLVSRPLFAEEEAEFLQYNPYGADLQQRVVYEEYQWLVSDDGQEAMVIRLVQTEDPFIYLGVAWYDRYYLRDMREEGVWLEWADGNAFTKELSRYDSVWVPFLKDQEGNLAAEFYAWDLEPEFPTTIQCPYETFSDLVRAEERYDVLFTYDQGNLKIMRITPEPEGRKTITWREGAIYYIKREGNQLSLVPVEFIEKHDEERIRQLKQTGLVLTEFDFGMLGYYTLVHEDQTVTAYLQEDTHYYYMGPYGTTPSTLEEMCFYGTDYLGEYRVLLDGDRVVWIAEFGLP